MPEESTDVRCNHHFIPTQTTAVHCPICNRNPSRLRDDVNFDSIRDEDDHSGLTADADVDLESSREEEVEEDEFDTAADYYEPYPRPVATSFINSLDSMKITVKEMNLVAPSSSCVICRDEFKLKESVNEMPCKHWFHSDCILKWLNLKSTCPLCRYELPREPEPELESPPGQPVIVTEYVIDDFPSYYAQMAMYNGW